MQNICFKPDLLESCLRSVFLEARFGEGSWRRYPWIQLPRILHCESGRHLCRVS